MAAVPYPTPQPVYFGHPAPGQIPQQATVFGFPQHLIPGMGPVTPVIMPHNMHSSMRHAQVGARHGSTSPHMYRQQQVIVLSLLSHPFINLLCVSILITSHCTLHQIMFGISYVPCANGVLASCVQWMIHPNASQGIRYMPNARNAAYPAMLPQGFPRAMPSLQQVDGSSLASVLASASPEVQQQVTMNRLLMNPFIVLYSTHSQTFKWYCGNERDD